MALRTSPSEAEDIAVRVARLREDAAEKTRDAARLLRICRKVEEKMAREEVKRSKYEEEAAAYLERSRFFKAKAELNEKMSSDGRIASEVVAEEVAASKNKAQTRHRKAIAVQNKIEGVNERLDELRESIVDHERRREELLDEARRLEAEAIRIQREPDPTQTRKV